MDVGFIGLGAMGRHMTRHLQAAGHTMTVHDIRREAATPFLEAGASWGDTPQQVAQASEVVFTSLPGPVEVEAVTLGRRASRWGLCRTGVRGPLDELARAHATAARGAGGHGHPHARLPGQRRHNRRGRSVARAARGRREVALRGDAAGAERHRRQALLLRPGGRGAGVQAGQQLHHALAATAAGGGLLHRREGRRGRGHAVRGRQPQHGQHPVHAVAVSTRPPQGQLSLPRSRWTWSARTWGWR